MRVWQDFWSRKYCIKISRHTHTHLLWVYLFVISFLKRSVNIQRRIEETFNFWYDLTESVTTLRESAVDWRTRKKEEHLLNCRANCGAQRLTYGILTFRLPPLSSLKFTNSTNLNRNNSDLDHDNQCPAKKKYKKGCVRFEIEFLLNRLAHNVSHPP